MSKYSMELRNVITYYGRDEVENWFKSYNIEDYLLPEQIEQLNEFPNIWSKDKLAKKIVDHYFMREIGFETPALFSHYAKVTMQEIMEEKLPLIYTLSFSYNPLINEDYTETLERNVSQEAQSSNEGQSNSTSSNTASSLNVSSDTPQGQISKQNILGGNYATAVGANENESSIEDETNTSSSSSGNNETEETYTRHFKGNHGINATYQALIKQFRDNIVAVDKQIIEELNSLFMGLY